MQKIKEKVAYLQGLTHGLNVDDHSAEGKLLVNIIDVLDDIAEEFQHINLVHEDLENYVESIDDDLNELEEEIYESEEDTEDDDYVEVNCPHCHENVTFESSVLGEDDMVEVTCPYCGNIVYDNSLEQGERSDTIDVRPSSASIDLKRAMHPGI
ncbi:MAG: AraC family transcriptional regulator [Pelosinus sp.]|nr:AraC family transcriptional regulator [Pelosinus sp.]